jgi:peptidoglycan/xylan/chitin deacetylase (PgdA/CDA1 family)
MSESLRVSITIDVEHDCPPFMQTCRGMEEGMPRLLDLFAADSIPVTFFTTGDMARRFPKIVERIVGDGHELGCHGDTHKRFSAMLPDEAKGEIEAASATLRRWAEVVSFRAPNLDLPEAYLPLLSDAGYAVDSSRGRHKLGSYFVTPDRACGLRRIPASISPSPLRTPGPVRDLICRQLRSPVVLFFHPWEFVDLSREPLRFDIVGRTGAPALHALRDTIAHFKRRGAQFQRIAEIPVA